jgi:hypothetical protein
MKIRAGLARMNNAHMPEGADSVKENGSFYFYRSQFVYPKGQRKSNFTIDI